MHSIIEVKMKNLLEAFGIIDLGIKDLTEEDLLIGLDKNNIEFSSKKYITQYNPDLFITQKDLLKTSLCKYIENRQGLCIISSIYNKCPYLFDYNIEKLENIVKEAIKENNDIMLIQNYINYFNNKYNCEIFKQIPESKIDFSKYDNRIILCYNAENKGISHMINILGHDNYYTYFFENGIDEIIMYNFLNCLYEDFEKIRKGEINNKYKKIYGKYIKFYNSYNGDKTSIDFFKNFIRLFYKYFGEKIGYLTKIKTYVYRNKLIHNELLVNMNLIDKIFNLSEYNNKINLKTTTYSFIPLIERLHKLN